MNNSTKYGQSGYTLIELTIGLAITSLVIASVLMGVQKLRQNIDLDRTIKQISSAAAVISNVMARDSDVTQISMEKMTGSSVNAFYLNNVTNPGTSTAEVYTALGNKISLRHSKSATSTSDGNPPDIRHFRILLEEVSPAICTDLVGGLEGIAKAVYVRIKTGLIASYKTVKDKDTVYSASGARSACSTTENNVLILEVKIYGI